MRIALLVLGAVFAAGAGAVRAGDAELDRIAAAAPGKDRYPDADAIVLKEARTVTLDGEGKRTERFYRLVKVLTPFGRGRFADPRFPFDSARQAFRVLRARTRMRDGTVVNTPKNGVNLVTPRAAANAPAYATLREAVVSHVGIEREALLEIEVEIADVKGGRKGLEGVEVFGGVFPVLEKTLAVKVPAGTKLGSLVAGAAWFRKGLASVDKAGTWTLEDVAPLPSEPHAPPEAEIHPRVAYSTWPSWKAWGDAYQDRFAWAAGADLPENLKGPLAEIRTAWPSAAERIAALDALVAKRVRKVDVGFDRLALRPCGETWAGGYGNAGDMAALFCAGLRAVGLTGRPVWISDLHTPLEKGPASPSFFRTLWIVVRAEEREWWIQPMKRVADTAFLPPSGSRAFHPGDAERPDPSPLAVPGSGGFDADVRGTLHCRDDGSATARLSVSLKGAVNPGVRHLAGEGNAVDFIEEKLKRAFPQGKITESIEVSAGPVWTSLTLKMEIPKALVLEGNRARLSLPETFFRSPPDLPVAGRVLPYRLTRERSEILHLQVRVPPSWELAAGPKPFSGEVKGALRACVVGGRLHRSKAGNVRRAGVSLMRYFLTWPGDVGEVFPPSAGEKMKTFRTLLSRWKAASSRTLIFDTGK
jgi:hypothetical protein